MFLEWCEKKYEFGQRVQKCVFDMHVEFSIFFGHGHQTTPHVSWIWLSKWGGKTKK